MSRFTLDHPTRRDVHAAYGWDHALGFFVDLVREGRERPIKSMDVFTKQARVDLLDALDFLATHGFFGHEHIEDALLYMRDGDEQHATSEALKIVAVIECFVSELD